MSSIAKVLTSEDSKQIVDDYEKINTRLDGLYGREQSRVAEYRDDFALIQSERRVEALQGEHQKIMADTRVFFERRSAGIFNFNSALDESNMSIYFIADLVHAVVWLILAFSLSTTSDTKKIKQYWR